MKKIILISFAVLLAIGGQAKGDEYPSWLNDVVVLPDNPTWSDMVTVTLSGTWPDGCIPNGSDISVASNSIYFDVIYDYSPSDNCPQWVSDWERTESVGPLSPGTYSVYVRLVGYPSEPETYALVTEFNVCSAPPDEAYNRPEPLMDYVPQEIGVFDGDYSSLIENDCRSCHSDSLVQRHHYSNVALNTQLCTPCHNLDPDAPDGITIERDCTVSGCHSAPDRGNMDGYSGDPPNGWHHATQLAVANRCSACHGYPIIDHNINDFPYPFNMQPPSLVTPSPMDCENCHWEQPVLENTAGWQSGDGPPFPLPSQAGHPSTYDHNEATGTYNIYGSQTPGVPEDEYFEYLKRIESNRFTHHALQHPNSWVNTFCVNCHSGDPNEPDWDPFDGELIRYCETCHDIRTLHAIEPHVGRGDIDDPSAVCGWEAVGFHVPDTDNADTSDFAPTGYRSFTANEQCGGCHGDTLFGQPPEPEDVPTITDVTPKVGTSDSVVTLTGENFGSAWTPDRSVQIQSTSGGSLLEVPTRTWTETEVQFLVPCGTFGIGNYYVSVETEIGASNVVVFTLTESDCSLSISPTTGKCREIITVSGGSATAQDIFNETSGDGVYRSIQVVGPSGTYIASAYGSWTATDFKFRLGDVFEDGDNDFLRDPGESLIRLCEGFSLGE